MVSGRHQRKTNNNQINNQNIQPRANSVVPKSTVNNTTTSKSKTINTTKKYSNKSEEYWPEIVNDLKQNGKIVLYTNLMNTKAVEMNDMTVGIQFPNGMTSFGKTVLEKPENVREITNLVSMACGKEMQIKYIDNSQVETIVDKGEDLKNLANESDIPFNIIDQKILEEIKMSKDKALKNTYYLIIRICKDEALK